MKTLTIQFGKTGPFDHLEQQVIAELVSEVNRCTHPNKDDLLEMVQTGINRLAMWGDLVQQFPSVLEEQQLGRRKRDIHTLVAELSRAHPANFDMVLPTRATLARDLVMGEVNFYRSLRWVCQETLNPAQHADSFAKVEQLLCECLFTRLAEEVLRHLVSDDSLDVKIREKTAFSLVQMWEQVDYRLADFFPVLEATWNARRQVVVCLGTLLGSVEMFSLIQAGCDPQFVEYLVRPEHAPEEAQAFREFLFGVSTEVLHELEEQIRVSKCKVVGVSDLRQQASMHDPNCTKGDPAIAMFEFFLFRHQLAAARREGKLPGPKRTAEEYVILNYLSS
jgi:hypothetical protein